MNRFVVFLIGFGLLLGGCARDVNLANDLTVDLTKPSPGLEQIMNNEHTVQRSSNPATPNGSLIPIPRVTPLPKLQAFKPEIVGPSTFSATLVDQIVDLQTTKGTIRLKLFTTEAPNTVANFLKKITNGFYNGLTFHRVEDWVIQGGDPDGNGSGGGSMPSEINPRSFKSGSLGVARGTDIKINNDSQFFICKKDCSWLTGQYTNFGEVVSGADIMAKIDVGDKIISLSLTH